MSQAPEFVIDRITDQVVRDNFRKLKEFMDSELVFSGFRKFEITFTAAEPHHRLPHGLGFLPKDIVLTSRIGSGVVSFNQDLSTTTELDLTSTGACVVRFIAGSFG